jgi:hemicentin
MHYYRTAVFLCVFSVVLSKSRGQSGIPDGAATLAFVFDTTGSMYDDLVQVRARASRILSESLKQNIKPLYNYALVPFHDPGE